MALITTTFVLLLACHQITSGLGGQHPSGDHDDGLGSKQSAPSQRTRPRLQRSLSSTYQTSGGPSWYLPWDVHHASQLFYEEPNLDELISSNEGQAGAYSAPFAATLGADKELATRTDHWLQRHQLEGQSMVAAQQAEPWEAANQFGDQSLLYSHASPAGHQARVPVAGDRWPTAPKRGPSAARGRQSGGGPGKGSSTNGQSGAGRRMATKWHRAAASGLAPAGSAVKGINRRHQQPAPSSAAEPRHHFDQEPLPGGGLIGQSGIERQGDDLPGVASSAAGSNSSGWNRIGGSASKRKHLVCYYGTWAVYRPDAGKYPVENIDPFLCTHVIYGFTGLSYDNLIKPLDPWNDLEDNYGKGAMRRFTNLKRINPDLKTLVAIGGWNEGSIKYSKMASEPEARARFVDSVVNFLAKYNFDGLDLDWEYPGSRGGASYDKQNFVKLLRELKDAFRGPGYLLTAAVSAGKWFIDPAYDIAEVSKQLDLINLMAYDYHGGWESKTGHNAPLFGSKRHDLARDEQLLNVNWSVNYWLQNGAPREKLMLGVGSYGRSFTLDKAHINGINAPASQKGQAGPYTREPGSLGYNEICEAFRRQPDAWTIVRDPDYLAPYAYNGRQWVGYDDQQSLALKAQFAKSMGLGGMMMWSIETDDFQGACHQEKYPLLNTIRRVLDGAPEAPANRPPTSTTGRPTSVAAGTGSTSPRPAGASSSRRPAGRPTTAPPAPTSTTPAGHEVEDEVPASTTRRPAASSSRRPAATSARPRPPVTGSPPTSSRRPRPPPSSTTTSAPSTGGPPPSGAGRPAAGSQFECQADGMFADPADCRKFYRCVSGGSPSSFAKYRFDCAPGTGFSQAQQLCDHLHNVPSCQRAGQRDQPDVVVAKRPDAPAYIGQRRPLVDPWAVGPQHPYWPGYFSHRFTIRHQWRR